jgi:hypothetical protein
MKEPQRQESEKVRKEKMNRQIRISIADEVEPLPSGCHRVVVKTGGDQSRPIVIVFVGASSDADVILQAT